MGVRHGPPWAVVRETCDMGEYRTWDLGRSQPEWANGETTAVTNALGRLVDGGIALQGLAWPVDVWTVVAR